VCIGVTGIPLVVVSEIAAAQPVQIVAVDIQELLVDTLKG
jgi:hypothetical protein